MSLAEWSLIVGALLVTMVLLGTLLGLPLGAAVLLGAILAPTDPVRASDLPAEPGSHPDRLGFSLAAEGGLNDGAAFPFIMIGLGLLGMADGIAQLSQASGCLAVFAAGPALQRVRERPQPNTRPLPAIWWFVLLLLVLRPLSVVAAIVGERLAAPQRGMIGGFGIRGIRGIGSVYYLLFALRQGLDPVFADTLVSLTLWSVVASIVAHGLSAQPLMRRYTPSGASARRRSLPPKMACPETAAARSSGAGPSPANLE